MGRVQLMIFKETGPAHIKSGQFNVENFEKKHIQIERKGGKIV